MIGQKLAGRYEIMAELGRGGMGAVYRAEDTLLKREVAVKVVSASVLGTEGRGRLLQEAQAAAGLNHPNIVAVHDAGETPMGENGDMAGFIVMELVQGNSLQGHQPESIQQLVDLGLSICAALEAAHDKGIIHRDLKPENILLTSELKVKLSDFGLARVSGATRLTREGTVMGTVAYMAPEIILGQPASVRSDLYALGIVLYELATGRLPFQGDTPVAILSQHLHAPVVAPGSIKEELPAEVEALIVQLLAKVPARRPTSAAEVGQRLASWNQDLAPAAVAVDRHRSQVGRLVRGRLVGRNEEMEMALETWGSAMAGQGQMLLVSGEPGIGKTRLVRELTAFAEVDGALVLSGECYATDDTPYLSVAQLIRGAFENGSKPELPPLVMADLAALAPELSSTMPDGEWSTNALEQHRLLDSVLALCRSLAASRPLLLVMEDAHWADSGTVNVLNHLARRLRDRPMLLVATYRGTDLDEGRPFLELLGELDRERLARRLKLTRLDQSKTGDLLATLLDEEITPDFLEAIYQETEGNPFFVEEISRALIDGGELFFENGRWHRAEIERMTMPQGVRVAIQGRLKRLNSMTQRVLQTAALLGRDFRYDRLVVASGEDEETLITALEHAEEGQIIAEVQATGRQRGRTHGPTFSFTHALIQSTLVESLSTLRRERLQRRMALALEAAFPAELEELSPMLGKFFAEAGEAEKAVHYLLATAEQARKLYAFEEAAQAYEGALAFLRDEADLELTARTLMKLGLIYQNDFEFERSRKAYDEGLELWRELGTRPGEPLPPATRPLLNIVMSEPPSLDPNKGNDEASSYTINQLFSGLLEITQSEELVPSGAASWDVLEGGRRYVFHLRRDGQWSDGHPVTAGDYAFSWKRLLSPELVNPTKGYLTLFDILNARAYHEGKLADDKEVGVHALDDWTLQVDLTDPVGYFLQLMAQVNAFPVPRHKVEALGDEWSRPENLVGNGAYRINSWTHGGGSTFVRNPYFNGPSGGNIKEVQRVVTNLEEYISYYEADKCAFLPLDLLEPQERARLVQQYPEEVRSQPRSSTLYLSLNTTRPPFDDVRVRRALALALDKKRVVRDLGRSGFTPALGGFVPPGIPGHQPGADLPFEPGRARALFREVGYGVDEKPLTLRIAVFAKHLLDALPFYEKQWARHLNIRLQPLELPRNEVILLDSHDDYHLVIGGWTADYPDPDNFLRVANIATLTGWWNGEYEELVENARVIADQPRRLAMYKQAEEILAREVPIIPLGYRNVEFLVKPWVKNPPTTTKTFVLWKDLILV